jgi:3D-(3,5/4)-trihydroxycyclohexane-1,2-dione acylhydrolase (decyclizing)
MVSGKYSTERGCWGRVFDASGRQIWGVEDSAPATHQSEFPDPRLSDIWTEYLVMKKERMTVAHALIRFLDAQFVQRDGNEQKFFLGCFGILGHGNIGGIGAALLENPAFRFYPCRNEQSMVHIAVGYAKMRSRLGAGACTSSIGPGATNMVTGAALATINRLPVLLLPGDIFARRNVGPVLQQLECETSQDVSVNDCFKPVSRYWDRINRPDQLVTAVLEAMRTLVSPANTGAVTLAMPQDVQTESYEYPCELFEKRVWTVPRNRPDIASLNQAVKLVRAAERPMIVAGGGVIYSEATETLAEFCAATGIPVGETQAGKGSLRSDHPQNLGAIGATGSLAANRIAAQADLVIGIGTRYSDFTTASKTAFRNPRVRFININVAELDSHKHSALSLTGDAKVTLQELLTGLNGWRVSSPFAAEVASLHRSWDEEVDRLRGARLKPLPGQAEVIDVINRSLAPRDVVVCAAGSLPGDLHKLWRCEDSKSYHLEYGYSCMGYEIPAAIGIKLADPNRDVFALVGDGGYLMMSSEIVTAIQEGVKIVVIVFDNHGYASIGGLSESLGCERFATRLRARGDDGQLSGPVLPVQFDDNARSLGADVIRITKTEEIGPAIGNAKLNSRTTVIVLETALEAGLPSYETWWDVPICETSMVQGVERARQQYEVHRQEERPLLSSCRPND